ncbi:sigma-70 family RNA polymerase sigma factor [Streptomyces sp. NPDC127033]|uniref:sigma-70 family RNA polymerase sigma factor n=1 Tax=Streptomyces sp. NPDC127033 TaxID=3347110 RepID=UPI003656E69F
MNGNGRDEPLDEPLDGRDADPADRTDGTAGGTGGGTGSGDVTSSRQLPHQVPGQMPEHGPHHGPGQVPNQGGPREPSSAAGVPGQGGPVGPIGPIGPVVSVGPVVPHPASGTGGPDGSVPPQRERTAGAEREPAAPGRGEPPPSDADLIQRMRDGDDSAYEELFRRHSEPVRRYARSCCRDAHTADDLTAEVFARTLQAVRGGAGPEQAVRAYLLTTVRRVAASWTKSAKREQLVDDFAVFAAQATRTSAVSAEDTLDLGADVLAMHEADRSMAMQAFRSLPERWQAVLWHTTVEEESPSEVAPLFGLTANATAVLASRAREGLKQAYLQAHVNSALTSEGDCSRYADRLGAYARGGLRMRAERGLRKHLAECAKCRLAAGELAQVNAAIPAVLPIAVIGWFAAGYSLKAAGVVAGGAVGAAGAGAAAAATGGTTGAATGGATGGTAGSVAGGTAGGASGGSAGAGAASEGLGAPAKAGIAGLLVVAAAGLVYALSGNSPEPDAKPREKPPVAQPLVPQVPVPSSAPADPPEPPPAPSAPAPTPAPSKKPVPAPPTPTKPTPEPEPSPSRTTPSPSPTPSPTPEPSPPPLPEPTSRPKPPPPPAPADYQVNELGYGVLGDGSEPEVRLVGSGWLWQRSNVSIGGARHGHGVTMRASSSVTIDLNRSCSSYAALVGVDDLTLGQGSVRFSLYGDGTRLWRSPVLHGGDAALPVQVGISGRDSIRLVVEPHAPNDVVALADWARSRISCP